MFGYFNFMFVAKLLIKVVTKQGMKMFVDKLLIEVVTRQRKKIRSIQKKDEVNLGETAFKK